jgi:hypothetical protein
MQQTFTNFKEGLTQTISAPVVPWGAVAKVFSGILLVVIMLILVFFVILPAFNKPKQENVQQLEGERKALLEKSYSKLSGQNSLYTSLIKQLDPLEQYLINLQPLTAQFGGYIGPMTDGVFSVEYYLQNALRMGIRSFVLPISTYFDDNKKPEKGWPYSGKPAIVFSDRSGVITSRNGLSITKFCESLLTYQNENPTQSEEPILLHIVPVKGHIPDPVEKEKEYVQLTGDIAEELKSIQSRRLMTLGPYGSAIGGQRETEILTQVTLNELKNKILVFTTFDTKLALKDAYKDIPTKLYEFANFLPMPLSGDAGTTTSQANALQGVNTGSGSKIIKLADISGSKINWPNQSRTTFYTTYQDSSLEAPTAAAVAGALKAGIHLIPVPFFYMDFDKNMEDIYKLWRGFAWKVKEKDARFKKPAPIVPAPPNPKMNARVDNTLQPGQTKIM